MHGGVGWAGKHERSKQEKGAQRGWVRRQTHFGVVVVEGVNHLLIVVFEWTGGDWYACLCVCVCVCVCVCACMHVCV